MSKFFFSFFFVEEGRQVDCNFYTKCFSSGSEHLYGTMTIGVLLLHLHYLLHANIVSYYGTFFILEKWLVPPPLTIGLSVSHFLSTLTRQSDVKRTLTLVFRTILSTEKELWTCAHLLYFNLLGLYACIVLYFLLVKFEFLHLNNINFSFVWN